MRLLDVTLLLQFIAKVNVCHFGKLQAQPALCTAVQVFNDHQASKNAVAAAGEAFLCVVYGGKIDDNLDVKRHQLYLRTIAKQKVCAKFDLATLPPTSAAARQHLVPGVTTSTAVAWCRLESYRLGMEAERWTPYTTPYTQRTCTRVATPPHNVQLQIGL